MSAFASVPTAQSGLPGNGPAARAFRALERAGDRVFGDRDNPLRQLGGLGFQLFWLISVTGIYLYVFYDTSLEGAWASVESLTRDQPWAGGVMRSLHRYASDAFVVVVGLHLVRELVYGRFRGFRWYSWVSGVPTLWLAAAAGVIGYWLVWDGMALFVATAVTEWFGALPGFGPSLVRNFVADGAMSDRFFSLAVFLHIGLPLALLLAMWAHIQRLTQPRTGTTRAATLWMLGALVAASLARPAASVAQADLASVPAAMPIDWFYLAPLVAIYDVAPEAVWAVALGATALLFGIPWIGRAVRPSPAVVVPEHCNGCTRCFADCPYAAIAMAPHPSGRGRIAVVDDDRCAACGICAGSCPSSTPFRSGEALVTGIDLPDLPIGGLRDELDRALARGGAPLVVFGCERGAVPGAADANGIVALGVPCAGMVPPSFVDYALRAGARGVAVVACPGEDCEFRFGVQWTRERFSGAREPRLRASVERARVRIVHAAREDRAALDAELAAFGATLTTPSFAPTGADPGNDHDE